VSALATSSSLGGGTDWFGPELSDESELLDSESSLEELDLRLRDDPELLESLPSVSAELSLVASGGSRLLSASEPSPAGAGSSPSPAGAGSVSVSLLEVLSSSSAMERISSI
jgi:hypothetical protein